MLDETEITKLTEAINQHKQEYHTIKKLVDVHSLVIKEGKRKVLQGIKELSTVLDKMNLRKT